MIKKVLFLLNISPNKRYDLFFSVYQTIANKVKIMNLVSIPTISQWVGSITSPESNCYLSVSKINRISCVIHKRFLYAVRDYFFDDYLSFPYQRFS